MLLVLNGAPGVGKSTLAQRYADEHPLTLVVDVDELRRRLGGWEDVDASKAVARDLAVALAGAHLAGGRDVVVPQYVGGPEFLDRLRSVAADAHTPFVEIVLADTDERIVDRFLRRRAEHVRAGTRHPEADLPDAMVATALPQANAALVREASPRGPGGVRHRRPRPGLPRRAAVGRRLTDQRADDESCAPGPPRARPRRAGR